MQTTDWTTPRWAIAALLAIAAWFVGTQLMHIFSEAINWDEFALLDRADRTLRLGQVVGGGRPGLVPIVLMPFVRDCIDSVHAVVNARLLWVALTLTYLVGVYWLLRRWFAHGRRATNGHPEALLAVALLAFLPAFVTWSLQVRTDQAALAAATLGGVALLSTGYIASAVAGAMFGVAILCSQKAVYVIALCVLLYTTATIGRALPWTGESPAELNRVGWRMLLATAATGVVIFMYAWLIPEAAKLASGGAVASSLETMRWTREGQGYRIYTVHARRLMVHWLLFGLLLAWTARSALRKDASQALPIATGWAVLLLGVAVAVFHGSSFPYFIMTAGLFTAVALALTTGSTLAYAGRMAWPVLVALIALSAMQSMTESLEMLSETQREQRETLRLAYELNLRNRRGYQVEGALFCSSDPDPIPTMFSQDIARHFRMSPKSAEHIADFISEFRSRPIAYLVESYRLRQFPEEIHRFFANHYVWYGKSLYLAGFRLDLSADEPRFVDVIVPGLYRWTPDTAFRTKPLVLNGQALAPLGELWLAVGQHTVLVRDRPVVGSLILADLPASERTGYPAFYHQRQVLQLGGYR